MIQIQLNGEWHQYSKPLTLHELLNQLNLSSLNYGVAISVNDEIVRKNCWSDIQLNDGDVLEIIHAVQGG